MKSELLRVEALKKSLNHDCLKHVNFNLFEKEILGIITRSSSQRKALFDILTGGLKPDDGRIFFCDRLSELNSKAAANRAGIYGVSRASSLILNMSIAENIFIDRSHISNFQIMNRKIMVNEAVDILSKAGLEYISPHTPVKKLTPAMRSSIEILKAVLNNAKLIIIDDVTVNFTERETDDFKRLLKYVFTKGISIIFISKRFNKLFDIAHRGVVMCNGMTADILEQNQLNLHTVISILSGCYMPEKIPNQITQNTSGELFLKTDSLHPELSGFSISLYRSEILGIYDEEWQYSDDISSMLSGSSKNKISVLLNGRKIKLSSIRRAVKNGICIINDKLIQNGFLYNRSLVENITLSMTSKINGSFKIFRKSRILSECKNALMILQCPELMTQFPENHLPDNISKNIKMQILVSRWLCSDAKVIVFVNPHTNFDDLTIDTFKTLLENIRRHGISIIIFSVSKTELLHTCDRIVTLCADTNENF